MKRRSFLAALLSLPFLRGAKAEEFPTVRVSDLPAEVYAFGDPPMIPVKGMRLGRVIVTNNKHWALRRHFCKCFPDAIIHGYRATPEGWEYLVSSESLRHLGPLDHIPLVGRY